MAKFRKLLGWQNIKLEKKQNCRGQTKLQELLIGIIVNKKMLKKAALFTHRDVFQTHND